MISVVIPVRRGGSARTTLVSLAAQTMQDFEIIVSWDEELRGANWARNRGAELATGDLLLFSDDDVSWSHDALERLTGALAADQAASWAYGAYEMGGRIQCDLPFDARRLRRGNYISTMSLVKRADFPGFDESVARLQDWDLWLTMTERGHRGVYCGGVIFSTVEKPGITLDGPVSWEEARMIVARKHGIA